MNPGAENLLGVHEEELQEVPIRLAKEAKENLRGRRKCFRLVAEAIFDFCIEHEPPVSFTTVRGIPPGARCVGIQYDLQSDCFLVLAEHPSFDTVPIGERVPQETVAVITQVRQDLMIADLPRKGP